jgi:hypothetical protein
LNLRMLYNGFRRWALSWWKVGGDLVDLFKPRGYVELVLIHADGPLKGQVARRKYVGRNVVTSWLSSGGAAPTGGRDVIRRKLVPSGFSGSLAGDSQAVIYYCELGTDGTTENAADAGLGAALSPSSQKAVSSVEFDATNPYVTFVFEYDQTEANGTLRELVILTQRFDVFARKTFGDFSNNQDFALQVRYTVRL